MRSAALVLLLAAGLAAGAWTPWPVANGSFELDANRDGDPDGWSGSGYDSPAQVAWDTVAHTGGRSVRVSDSKPPTPQTDWKGFSGRWIADRTTACQPGQSFTLSGYVKTDLTEGYGLLSLAWFSAGKWLKEDSTPRQEARGDWRLATITAQAPAGADLVRVYLCVVNSVGSVWFDDVSLVPGGALPTYQPIDLRAACTTGFADETAGDGRGGWTDQGANDLREIPTGRQSWRGVPFDIVDPQANGGKSCVVLRGRARPDLPAAAEVPVGRAADVLYFLHATAWAGVSGLVARYRVEYADGRSVTVPIRAGEETCDWWRPADTASCAVGWEGRNAESDAIGLVIFPWVNPTPQSAIAQVRLEATGGDPLPLLVAITAGTGPALLEDRPIKLEVTDTTNWYEWALDGSQPGLGELNLSGLLDPPAGKHGFLKAQPDGRLVFEDGTRARFFGTNVGGGECSPTKEVADLVADRLAQYGCNLLRLHAPDGRWAPLLDYARGTSQELNAAALDRYDYFVAALLKRGIYVYFDLLDYRQFLPGDGVRDAAELGTRWENSLKGASIFDRRMIELQKDFATKLLTHRNPYTGRRYVDEPGLAVQEITNENSLFYLSNQKLMLPSYVADLTRLWAAWLARRYPTRAALVQAWGEAALLPAEDPAQANVALPLRFLYADPNSGPGTGERHPARLNALTRFLYELEVAYYDELLAHLRGLGLKCPITGTNQDFSDASNLANARCDLLTRNNYWCHPDVDSRPMRFSNAPLVRTDLAKVGNPIASICSSTAVGRGMIVPEFNFPWPNEWRAECLPLLAAYGRLQDWDGLLYFAYGRTDGALNSFGNRSDPVRWGQMPLAALTFLRGDFDVAKLNVEVGVSEVDAFTARRQRVDDRYSPYRILPFISRVRNSYFTGAYRGDADLVISSGHSAAGDYRAARRAILFADWPYADLDARQRDRGRLIRDAAPGVRTRALEAPLTADGLTMDTVVDPASLPPGATPLTAGGQTVGFATDRLYAHPNASTEADPSWLHRVMLDAANRWNLASKAPVDEAGKVFRSDTGQLVLDRVAGVFTATAPRARFVVGFLGGRGALAAGDVTVDCRTPFAAVSLVTLDGRPVGESRRLLLTAVARSENLGQAFVNNHRALAEFGRAPVRVEPVDATVTVPGQALRAWPLSPQGEKVAGRELPVTVVGGKLVLDTRDARSPWVLLAP